MDKEIFAIKAEKSPEKKVKAEKVTKKQTK
jgi:hypothetical protein